MTGSIDLSTGTVIVLCAIMALAGFIQAAAGFGLALLAVPLMSLVIAPQTAVVAMFFAGTLSSLLLATTLRGSIEPSDARRLSVGAIVAMPIGVVLLLVSPSWLLRLALGVVTISAAVWLMIDKPHRRAARTFRPTTTYAVGAVSGVLNTALATNGPPLVVYLQSRALEPLVFRATISFVFVISSLVGLVMLFIGGAVHVAALWVFVVTLLPGLAGWTGGYLIAGRLDHEHFARIADVLLIVGGALSIAKAIGA